MPRRAGFTLLELLTVMGIFAVVAGIAWAGIIGARRTAGLTGAAQMISGFTRQAHSTALSSGAPVQVLIDGEARTVSGVSQTPLIWDAFEDRGSPGFAGRGLVFNHRSPSVFPSDGDGSGDGAAIWTDSADAATVEAQWFKSFPPNQILVRDPSDGFYISCWVKPPPVRGASPGQVLPLILIGRDSLDATGIAPDPDVASPDDQLAYVGLTLQYELLEVQSSDGGLVQVPHWLPVAWITTDTFSANPDAYHMLYGVYIPDGTVADVAFHPSVIGSLAPSGIAHEPINQAPIYPVARPILGDNWVQLGLLFDGQRMSIFQGDVEVTRKDEGDIGPLSPALIDEIRGGRKLVSPPLPLVDDVTDLRCYLGRGTWRTGPQSGETILAEGMIDELRVVRIGTDRPQRLPAGVTCDNDYRILSSDGSLSVYTRPDATSTWVKTTDPITLTATDGSLAEIVVSSDGTTKLSYGKGTP